MGKFAAGCQNDCFQHLTELFSLFSYATVVFARSSFSSNKDISGFFAKELLFLT